MANGCFGNGPGQKFQPGSHAIRNPGRLTLVE
jgi:hypothetical protein